LGGEFNRSTQHPSLERTDCWCRSNFSNKSQDIRHRSRFLERLRRYPPILAALPALSALCLQRWHEPCPCMSLHMYAIPTWRIRVKGCCVDRLSPPPESDRIDAFTVTVATGYEQTSYPSPRIEGIDVTSSQSCQRGVPKLSETTGSHRAVGRQNSTLKIGISVSRVSFASTSLWGCGPFGGVHIPSCNQGRKQ
jgi:hypothetical protein